LRGLFAGASHGAKVDDFHGGCPAGLLAARPAAGYLKA
jgi:hypothetical protein